LKKNVIELNSVLFRPILSVVVYGNPSSTRSTNGSTAAWTTLYRSRHSTHSRNISSTTKSKSRTTETYRTTCLSLKSTVTAIVTTVLDNNISTTLVNQTTRIRNVVLVPVSTTTEAEVTVSTRQTRSTSSRVQTSTRSRATIEHGTASDTVCTKSNNVVTIAAGGVGNTH
jgi:hypothetical protein